MEQKSIAADDAQSRTLLRFFRAVGQPERLKLLGLLANRPATVPELAAELEMREHDVSKHLKRLANAGLVQLNRVGFGYGTTYHLQAETLAQFQTTIETNEPPQPFAACVRSQYIIGERFVDGVRLKAIPADPAEREVILEWLAGHFEANQRYSESRAIHIISQFYPKQELLLRYLVDGRYLKRLNDIYWRNDKAALHGGKGGEALE